MHHAPKWGGRSAPESSQAFRSLTMRMVVGSSGANGSSNVVLTPLPYRECSATRIEQTGFFDAVELLF